VSVGSALDLLHAVLSGWSPLFLNFAVFQTLLKDSVCGALIPLLKSLQEDFATNIRSQQQKATGGSSASLSTPAAMTTRAVRVARCIMLQYQVCGALMMEIEAIITCLVHTLQPERNVDAMVRQLATSTNMFGDTSGQGQSGGGGGSFRGLEEHSQSTSGLISRLAMSSKGSGSSASSTPAYNKGGMLLPLGIMSSSSGGSTQSNVIYIPSHPAGVCLEAVLSMFLAEDVLSVIARGDNGKEALPTILTSVILTAVSMLSEAMIVETNVRWVRFCNFYSDHND
jgi:hypothetical protein